MSPNTDRIEKQLLLQAPRSRVWRALTDTREFSQWFRVALTGKFVQGARIKGPITYEGYEHLEFSIKVERLEPERVFAWSWTPHAHETQRDYSAEPPTLVTFELEDAPGGTLLKVTETGFDKLPADRRAQAYRGNEGGWSQQLQNIEKHVRSTS